MDYMWRTFSIVVKSVWGAPLLFVTSLYGNNRFGKVILGRSFMKQAVDVTWCYINQKLKTFNLKSIFGF